MASKRVALILKARTKMTDEEISKLTDFQGWQIIYHVDAEKRKAPKRLEICFTGFTDDEKRVLWKQANDNGLQVVGSVTKHLAFLVTGGAPGPMKLEKANSQKTTILNHEQFNKLIQHGELPANEEESQIQGPEKVLLYGSDRITYAMLAIFLGWAGAHKFYLGRIWVGLFYLCFSFLSLFIGVYEGVSALRCTDQEFIEKITPKEPTYI
jgi:hypothetical protein